MLCTGPSSMPNDELKKRHELPRRGSAWVQKEPHPTEPVGTAHMGLMQPPWGPDLTDDCGQRSRARRGAATPRDIGQQKMYYMSKILKHEWSASALEFALCCP